MPHNVSHRRYADLEGAAAKVRMIEGALSRHPEITSSP